MIGHLFDFFPALTLCKSNGVDEVVLVEAARQARSEQQTLLTLYILYHLLFYKEK